MAVSSPSLLTGEILWHEGGLLEKGEVGALVGEDLHGTTHMQNYVRATQMINPSFNM